MKLKVNRIVKNWKHASMLSYVDDFAQNPISPGRRYAPQKINVDLWKKAYAEYNLNPMMEDPFLGSMVMHHYDDGACTQRHKDKTIEGFTHVRINIMLKKSPIGGDIYVDDEELKIEQNDMWLILTNLEEHGSTPISGGDRLVYSFGSLIPTKELGHLCDI
tara:strand:- start:3986 stop:4468 length:483 start_codon:yes stop_codon:yes gene_type:complete